MYPASRFLIMVVLTLTASACSGPLGPIPGGALNGDPGPAADDWAFAADADHLQLETIDAAGKPYSVNVWSGVVDGRLFIPTSLVRGAEQPAERGWVQNASANSAVRVRIDELVYPGEIKRVTDPDLTRQVKAALAAKYASEADERAARAWVFEVTSLP
ncbi:MAG: hypothetical protein AAF993_06470 [Pseudomonadota bacterium]